MKRQLAIVNLRLVLRAASRTICVAEAECSDVLAVTGPHAAARLAVIHNGVDPVEPLRPEERAGARASLGVAADAVVGVYLGSLDAHKDPLVVARAAVEVAAGGAPFVLLVAGEGPLSSELERLARGSEALRLLGHRSDVRTVLGAADLFVLPSLREGFSFALLEAMALGLAPVVSDAPGNPEAVGDAGIVVLRGDAGGFATAFRRLAGDEPGRQALGRQARERATAAFNASEMIRRTRELYDEVLSRLA